MLDVVVDRIAEAGLLNQAAATDRLGFGVPFPPVGEEDRSRVAETACVVLPRLLLVSIRIIIRKMVLVRWSHGASGNLRSSVRFGLRNQLEVTHVDL